jgi:putative addiction module antidote
MSFDGEDEMSEAVKVRAIGNSLGVILPRDVLTRSRIAEGDTLHVVDTADGLRLVRHNPEFARQMEVAREVMRRRSGVLRELAK